MMTPQELYNLVSQIREGADIVRVIGESVRLKKSGDHFIGLCPFEKDRTIPAFQVSPLFRIYMCHDCGEAGDALQFVSRFEKCSWLASIGRVADRCGIDLPDEYKNFFQPDAAEREMVLPTHIAEGLQDMLSKAPKKTAS